MEFADASNNGDDYWNGASNTWNGIRDSPSQRKWLLPEKGEEEGKTIRLSDRKVVNSEVDAVDYDRYRYQPPFLWKNILI